MANPVYIDLPVNVITKVLTNVTAASIKVSRNQGADIFETYKITGDPAPTELSEFTPWDVVTFPIASINVTAGIDVYLYAKTIGNVQSVKVRIDA